MFEYELIERAKATPRKVVLPEGEDERVLRAAEILLRRGVCDLTILGAREAVDGAEIVDPLESPLLDEFASIYYDLRKHKGITEELAYDRVANPSYFGTLLVQTGRADGMVSGAAHTTADTIRPAFEIIKARDGRVGRVERLPDVPGRPRARLRRLRRQSEAGRGAAGGHRHLVGGDRRRLRDRAADRDALVLDRRVREGRGRGPRARGDRGRARARPDLKVEGPIQYDAAVDAAVAELKLPDSEVAGRATVFVFPDLEAGNVAYKAVQRSAGAVAIGPVLQGLRKPVNDLSRGCTVTDIVNTVAITAIQAGG